MKTTLFSLALMFMITSCGIFGSLTSNTVIKPNDSFILGNNEHGSFNVKLKNVSTNDLEIYQAPINGGKHSTQIVKPNGIINLKVESNTALIINNKSSETASVDLKVTGDTGLSMGYKN